MTAWPRSRPATPRSRRSSASWSDGTQATAPNGRCLASTKCAGAPGAKEGLHVDAQTPAPSGMDGYFNAPPPAAPEREPSPLDPGWKATAPAQAAPPMEFSAPTMSFAAPASAPVAPAVPAAVPPTMPAPQYAPPSPVPA